MGTFAIQRLRHDQLRLPTLQELPFLGVFLLVRPSVNQLLQLLHPLLVDQAEIDVLSLFASVAYALLALIFRTSRPEVRQNLGQYVFAVISNSSTACNSPLKWVLEP